MTNHSPYIDADGGISLVPSSLHNPGTGVEELGDLVLNTRDITRLDELIEDRLVEWWAGVAGVPVTTADRGALGHLYASLVLPAASQVSTNPNEATSLELATEESHPDAVPDIDVLIHPDAVTRTLRSFLRQ